MSSILAIDEGTTSTRAAVFDLEENKIKYLVQNEIKQIYLKENYVEQNANEIFSYVYASIIECLENANDINEIKGIGITNQRETVIMWDKITGKPLYNAIVWQCRRTAKYCEEIKEKYSEIIKKKTGLIVDAYFSASKINWLLKNVPEAQKLIKLNRLCVGTIDSYLVFKLTNGGSFVTDITNASRTMLFNIHEEKWDDELLNIFEVPKQILPKVISCDEVAGNFSYRGHELAICGIAGDQQSALFGQCCFNKGQGKITYGTGMFMLFNTGDKAPISNYGLVTTIGYKVNGKTSYALEGSVFNAGSSVQWLRDELNLFKDSSESELFATKVKDNGGVYIVPAFTGLGAPYWNSGARGLICGLTRSSNKYHITRAVLEAMAYSAKELSVIMEKDSDISLSEIKVDGGGSSNNFLMQFQADMLGINIDRPIEKESTIMGVVYLCCVGLKLIDFEKLKNLRKSDRVFVPKMNREERDKLFLGYKKAIERSLL